MHGAGVSGEATPRIHPLSSAHAHAACKSCTANVAVRIIDEAEREKLQEKQGRSYGEWADLNR